MSYLFQEFLFFFLLANLSDGFRGGWGAWGWGWGVAVSVNH